MDELYEDTLILNRYRPIDEAGSGGFATVQLAWDTRIQRRVAVKCMPLEGFMDTLDDAGNPPSTVPGLEEARTAALLNNPNIVSVYDFEVQDDTAYLIMEYVDGMTLSQLLRECDGNLSIDMVTAVFDAVSHALEFAHENQVLHLDVKPDNILIDHQGQVKVTDFGLSRLSDVLGYSAATGGTIGFMPPEQIRQEPLDQRCDEWALASVAYEMLTGTNPFLAPDFTSALSAIEDAEIVLPSLCKEGVSPEIDDVLFYALDPDRYERYSSVADFAEEMDRFLGNAKQGQKELAAAVRLGVDDETTDEQVEERLGLFDRLGSRGSAVLLRLWSVANVGLLGAVSLMCIAPLGGWTAVGTWGLLALLVLAAAIVPTIGALAALAAVAAMLLVNQAYVAGGVVAVVGVAWWVLVGRVGAAQSVTGLSSGPLGLIGFDTLSPLLSGFFLRVPEAAANAVLIAVLAVVFSGLRATGITGWSIPNGAFSGDIIQANILATIMTPSVWPVLVAWVAAAAAESAFCSRGTRLFAMLGAFVGGLLIVAGACLSTGVATGFGSFVPATEYLVPAILATLFMLVVSWFGCPARDEDTTLAPRIRRRG